MKCSNFVVQKKNLIWGITNYFDYLKCHDPIWGIVTGAREWEGVKPPKPVASLTGNTYTNYHAITCQNVNISI